MEAAEIDRIVDEVCGLLESARHAHYIGEPISQLEHGLQAAHFASAAGADDEHILAALFHDIGHLCADDDAPRMDALGVMQHEAIGAQYLRERGFSETICSLVQLHVAAKRYQVHRRPAYRASLSEASLGTLAFQGGAMTSEQADAFEQHPLFKGILAVRAWDEMAKDPELDVADLSTYRRHMRDHLLHAEAS